MQITIDIKERAYDYPPFRYRVGDYRILFVAIKHRREAYA